MADSSIIDKVVTKTETVLTTKLEEAGFDAAAVTSKVNANKAKSIIIMNSAASWRSKKELKLADAMVLKSIMSIMAVCNNENHPPIVCEIHSDKDRDLAQNITTGTIKALNEVSVLSRMIAQLALSRNGLSIVYGDMVGFDGNEFYFYRPDNGWGESLTFGESLYRFKSSTPMGIHTDDGKIILNPPKETSVNNEDELIVFAEDDSTIHYFNEPIFKPQTNKIPSNEVDLRTQRIALLNWTPKTEIIMENSSENLDLSENLITRGSIHDTFLTWHLGQRSLLGFIFFEKCWNPKFQRMVEKYVSRKCPKSMSLDSGHLDKQCCTLILHFFKIC